MRHSYHAGPSNALHVPVHGGVWIRNSSEAMEGTLGCIVTRKDFSGTHAYALTCQHVAIPSGPPVNSFDIVAQPPAEYSSARNIGRVVDVYGPPSEAVQPPSIDPNQLKPSDIPAYSDFALISLDYASYSFDIPGIGIPTGVIAPRKGMNVKMLGARTGFHRGTILEPDYKLITSIEGGWLVLNHIVVYDIPHDNGDSGAVVVDEATNKVVGIAQGIAVLDGGKEILKFCTRADYAAQVMGINFAGMPGVFGRETGEPVHPPGETDPIQHPGGPDYSGLMIMGGAIIAGYLVSQTKL